MSKTISKYLLTVALITMASLANVSGVSANPIPFGRPYVVMTTENMSIDIAPDHTVEMTGTYTFHLTYDEGYPFF